MGNLGGNMASDSASYLVVGGVKCRIPELNAVEPDEMRERLQLALVALYARESGNFDSNKHSLPETMMLGEREIDFDSRRQWMAVGIGESKSWISDLEVIEGIARYGF
jgi:hypothetical protein